MHPIFDAFDGFLDICPAYEGENADICVGCEVVGEVGRDVVGEFAGGTDDDALEGEVGREDVVEEREGVGSETEGGEEGLTEEGVVGQERREGDLKERVGGGKFAGKKVGEELGRET